jgi:hypothetical protein
MVTALAGAASRAEAAIAYVISDTTGNSAAFSPLTLGFQFATNQAIAVTDLGVFDSEQNGLTDPHDIGIWDSGGSLLASATVSSGTIDPLTNQFRYVPIVPVLLAGGQDYRIGAFYTGPADMVVLLASGFATDPVVTFVGARFASSGTLSDPTTPAGPNLNPGYFGPNFQFAAVPEPGTPALTGLGMLGLGVWLRRRK